MQDRRQDLHRQPDPVKNKLFRSAVRLAIVVFLLCVIAQRSPAPIVETPDNPAPPPTEQPPPQKWKRPAKPRSETATTTSKESRQKPASTGPARFAGNWSGSISLGLVGMTKISFSINGSGTSVRFAGAEKPATINGNTITWKAGWFTEATWTLTPQRDGTSALVTSKSALGVNGTATFSRGRSETASAPPSQQPPVTPPPSN